ncbi:hypothetical protein H9L14_14265 [Sphingomonas sediminicola]|uniref:Uncharacterized protein n=1 Tax=Sphingomonas sediminicola TaxID=386874 RepID=A0ABX6T730_9SPHN|nr:hypothetical protein [Sphingomonas sediminicola]QNP45667.1 hypothetical protein H9L14_14265 [Sphingomonas sediminicola]
MNGAVESLASDLLYDAEDIAADAAQKWLIACRRRHDWQDLYPFDGSELQKAAYARVETEIREELLSLEAKLIESFSRLHRARSDIAIPHCPACWVEDKKQVKMRHERDHRYDRTDNDYSCPECGHCWSSVEGDRHVG